MPTNLPQGFILDQPVIGSTLPQGFSLDEPEEERGFGEQALGVAENVGALVSGAVAEPIAGLRGIYEQVTGGDATKAIEETREAMSYQPRTEAGKEYQQDIGEALQPVIETLSETEKFLGENVLELTGSPELAAIAHTLPTAALEALGVKTALGAKAAKGISKNILKEVAPSKDDLKSFSRSIYKEIDNSGTVIKDNVMTSLSKSVSRELKAQGYNKRTTPKIRGIIEELSELEGTATKVSDLDAVRRVAQTAAKSTEAAERRLASIAIDKIDGFMDRLTDNQLDKGKGFNVGTKYKDARKSWQKVKKLETVEEIMEDAKLAASGEENGIRQGFTRLLRNKKKLKGFSKVEIDAMKDISQGGGLRNTLKKLGKLGFGEGKAGSMLGNLAGIGGGAAAFGPAGAVAVPVIGQVSRKLSQVLTKNKSALLNDIIASGSNGQSVVNAYIKHVPRSSQSAANLAEILLKSNIDVSDIRKYSNITKRLKDDLDFYIDYAKTASGLGAVAAPGAIEAGRD